MQLPVVTINSGPGNAEAYGDAPARVLRWTIAWKSLEMSAVSSQLSTGLMSDVTGTIYDKKGGPTVRFSARSGVADRASNFLRLHGNVRITSVQRKEILMADAVRYDATPALIHAIGNVQFQGNVGTIGTFSELTATSDLKRVGTPDMFSNQ